MTRLDGVGSNGDKRWGRGGGGRGRAGEGGGGRGGGEGRVLAMSASGKSSILPLADMATTVLVVLVTDRSFGTCQK